MMRWVATPVMLLALAAIAEADDSFEEWFPQGRAVLQAGKEVQGDYFAFGPHVEISGTVNGDVYAAGGDVLVDGTVNGDLIATGGKIVVSGKISQDARIAGGQVTISGTIGRNVSVGGGDVQATDTAQIHGNWLGAAGNVQLAGQVDGDARIGGGNVTVSNGVGGDLMVAAPSIRLTSRATIGKNFKYWSEEDPSIDEGATIRGAVARRPVPESLKSERFHERLAGLRLAGTAASFISTLILGLLLVSVYPVFTRAVEWTIRERPGASAGAGAIFLIGIPTLAVFSLVTVIGIPIGLVVGALFVVTLYLARIFVMVWAGRLILELISAAPSIRWSFVTGLVLYFLFMLIPFVGGAVTLITVIVGLGALLLAKKELVERLREQRLV